MQEKQPSPFGICLTAENLEATEGFYRGLYQYDDITRGVFAGIKYSSLMRDGEVAVCIFEKTADNPLAAEFPVLQVTSVPDAVQKVTSIGGKVLIPQTNCPCTGAPFSICVDVAGNQFMVKQLRGS